MSLRIPQCLTLVLLLVATSGCYAVRSPRGGGMTETSGPRVVNAADVVVPDGYLIQPVAQGLTFPVGLTFDGQGHPVVVESGYSYGEVWTTPRLIRVSRDGSQVQSLLDGLPSMGDHHTNAVVIHEDWIYFGQGTATNSAVVGEDNASFGWLARHPGQVIEGKIPCTGAIMRMKLGGGPPELVAWGLRNPFAMAFTPDGELYALDNSYDDRGSRPVHGTGDLLWAIVTGGWYGWPDYHGPRRLDHGDHFKSPGREEATPLIANPPGTAINRGSENGPASRLKTRGLERPVSVKFSPDGSALYIVDFGVLPLDDEGAHPQQGPGVLWRVTRNTAARAGGQ